MEELRQRKGRRRGTQSEQAEDDIFETCSMLSIYLTSYFLCLHQTPHPDLATPLTIVTLSDYVEPVGFNFSLYPVFGTGYLKCLFFQKFPLKSPKSSPTFSL